MHSFTATLRQLYHPRQPAVADTGEAVSYRETLPHPALQDFVYCYWQLKSNTLFPTPFTYRVVADGCMDIIINLDNPADHFIMGISNRFTGFPLPVPFHYTGIRFRPAMFPQLFRIDAATLSNRVTDLQLVLPQMASFLRNRLYSGMQAAALYSLLDNFLLQQIAGIHFRPDNRLYEAIALILQYGGNIAIEKELAQGISPRQLRRLFATYIGDTPKTFSKIVRFQQLLQANPSGHNLRRDKLYFDAGYYDQAHFIKEFRQFYGLTPRQAFV